MFRSFDVGRGETALGADLGGSSKYSNENIEASLRIVGVEKFLSSNAND